MSTRSSPLRGSISPQAGGSSAKRRRSSVTAASLGAADELHDLIEKLQVYPENMVRNLGLTKGLYFSQSILLALTRAGANRQTASFERASHSASKASASNVRPMKPSSTDKPR